MVVFMLIFYDLILYTVDFKVLLKFMDHQYGKSCLSCFHKNLLILLMSILSGLLLWNSPFGGTYPFFSVLFSTVFLFFYPQNRQKKLFFSTIQFVSACYQIVLITAVIHSFEIDSKQVGIHYFFLLGGMHLFFWLLLFILGKISNVESAILPSPLFLIIFVIPVVSFLVLIFFIIRINNNPNILFSLEFPLILAFILINVITAFIYGKFCNLLKKTSEVLLLKQQINLSEQYFQDLTEAQNKLKGIRHDMKNHLQSLLLMSDQISPQTKEIKNIQEYLQQLLSGIQEASQIVSTGNMGMDAILSLKIAQIRELQIAVNSVITVPADINFSIEDSIIILGNILDNALKACRENPAEKRWIRLEVRYIPHSLFIRITNPLPIHAQCFPYNNSGEHGFGLKNIRTAIKKYNGTIEIENNGQTFTVKIILYNL